MSKIDVICDHSQQNLKVVPLRVLDMCNLQMLYLEGNELETLPLNIFQRLPKLNWLDLRNNQLREIPVGVANHACLENLLLEQNSLVRLPNELGLVPNLTVLQLAKNPLTYPSQNIISKGTKAVSFYLRNEYNKEHDLPLECEETAGAFFRSEENEKITKKKRKSSKIKADVRELLRKASLHRKLQIENMPTISIKSLSPKSSSNEIKSKESSSEAQHSPRKTHKVTRSKENSIEHQRQYEQRIKDLRSRVERGLAREIEAVACRARKKLAAREKPPSPQILEIDEEARTTARSKAQRKTSRSSIRHESRLRKDAVAERSGQRFGKDLKTKEERTKEEMRLTETYQRINQSIENARSRQRSKSRSERSRKKRKGDTEDC